VKEVPRHAFTRFASMRRAATIEIWRELAADHFFGGAVPSLVDPLRACRSSVGIIAERSAYPELTMSPFAPFRLFQLFWLF
jgi:hypothetical protein